VYSTVYQTNRQIALWLFVCCAMIAIMVMLGGLTRLTHSGLSMVEWKPLTGWLPPLNAIEWQATFERYQQYPQFLKLNQGMDVEGFKSIFWLEYLHRVWGRLIGFVFLIPFLYFLLAGKLRGGMVPKFLVMFVLGGLQGGLGWYMVKSGMVDHPDVSHFRLAAHLGAAFFIYAYIFWTALGLYFSGQQPLGKKLTDKRPEILATLLLVLVFTTVMSGALVAGLDAGLAFNTFPKMGGQWLPDGLLMLSPPIKNAFDNLITVQFNHRVLAMIVFLSLTIFWIYAIRKNLPARVRLALHCMMLVLIAQVTLGISTLLLAVPVHLASAHQMGALLLFTSVLWVNYELRHRPVP
jgi:cytochrome c oxidase assembly protein subunit 15